MDYIRNGIRFLALVMVCVGFGVLESYSQSLLNKPVTIEADKKPVAGVLKSIGEQGGFYFSYNSNLVKKDSLVTVYARRKTVKEVLDMLFDGRYEYKEKSNYIIIQNAPEHWYVSGYITDAITGDKIINASVYEKQQMVSTLTDEQGYFRLKLRDKTMPAVINVNRSWYADTSLIVRASSSSEIIVSISPKNFQLDTLVVTQYNGIEKSWWGKVLLSSRQRMQSLNINKFFVDMPYQTSFTPGISTHGRMGSQVVNKVSFNVLGGYTAGTNGVEIGGLFNMVRKDARYVQIAGLFNNVGGKVEGVQIGGLFNNVLDTVTACQVAGLSNTVKGAFEGAQIAGISNFTNHDFNGTQVAGISNIAGRDVKGVQVAGIVNTARGKVEGMQVAGVVNVAKTVVGTQLGLINVADSCSGFSIGLLPLIRKGYHKLSISTNEAVNTNLSVKLGTNNFYSIFLGGMNIGAEKVYTFGFGWGADIPVWKWISLNPEITFQHLYLGDWENTNLLTRIYTHISFRLNKYLAIYAGPVLNVYARDQEVVHLGYKPQIPGGGYNLAIHSNTVTSWIGWNAGITLL